MERSTTIALSLPLPGRTFKKNLLLPLPLCCHHKVRKRGDRDALKRDRGGGKKNFKESCPNVFLWSVVTTEQDSHVFLEEQQARKTASSSAPLRLLSLGGGGATDPFQDRGATDLQRAAEHDEDVVHHQDLEQVVKHRGGGNLQRGGGNNVVR